MMPFHVCREYATIPSEEFRKTNQDKIGKIEEEKAYPFWDYYEEYTPERILLQFKNRKEGEKVKQWEVIPAEQYHTLLRRYMDNPVCARIPDSTVTDWIMLICRNLAQVISIEKLFARCTEFPESVIEDIYGAIKVPENYPEYLPKNQVFCLHMEKLSVNGFYKWAVSPTGNPAWNDWGFFEVYQILKEYKDGMDPGDKLILVNRCLDVVHGRGKMSEYFIEGGDGTCNRISGK